MTKISSGGGVFNSLATRRVVSVSAFLVLASALAITPSVFGAGSTNGSTRVEMEVSTSIAMKIASPNDVDPDCIAETGKTYGVANRYASSTGEGGKVVDTFNGNEGEADELNTNTSCAKLSMEPNNFDSTYSDVTVFTNSPSGYALTVQSAENVSPNLVNVSDNTQYIPAGTLTENNGTVTGGQNKWAYKTNNGIITDWTAMSTTPAPIKAYDNYTEGGDTTRVTYGISTGNNPTGTYTTELTYTATMFDGPNPYMNYMQDFNADEHASDAVGTEYTVFDSRDKREYTAAKLADGNIWMTEDLKLDGGRTLTPADSDVTVSFNLLADNNGTWCDSQDASCFNQSLMTKQGAPNGYLYNWYAATAGTGTYEISSGNATASICPKGWKLPTGGPSGQFVSLDIAYGGDGTDRAGTDIAQVNKFMAPPLNFNYTGFYYNDSTVNSSDIAIYWTSTALTGISAHYFYMTSDGSFKPQDYSYQDKNLGFAVRCVAEKTDLSDITNMQDMTPAVVANTAVGASKTLTDTRGGSYTVTKLADNNIWMTQDLKLGGSSALTLTPDDSDVISNYTLPAENTGTWCTDQSAACYDQSLMIKTGAPNGYLYNWYAVTAGTGTYELSSGNATASICPKGWKLPTGGISGQFVGLDQAYGGNGTNRDDATQRDKFMTVPLYFNYTGYRYGGSIHGPSGGAFYWARTANLDINAHYLHFNSGDRFYPQDNNSKNLGLAIRCVAAS